MKPSVLFGVLCASLIACCETAPVEDASLASEVEMEAGPQFVSYRPEKTRDHAEDTGPASESASPRHSGNPMTRIIERAGIDPNRKTIRFDGSKTRSVSFKPRLLSEAVVGRAAPDFELKDLTGKPYKLSRYEGRAIVLEWFNPDCPFVKYAHESGPLEEMPEEWKGADVVWIAINSGASSKLGASPTKNVKSVMEWKMRYPLLFDPTGEVGKLYKATTTPHMFVIDEDFTLRYAGALDNAPMGKQQGEYRNFVEEALEAISKGSPCPKGDKPYGCGVKYAD